MNEDQKYRESNLFRRLMAEALRSVHDYRVHDYIAKLREIDGPDDMDAFKRDRERREDI